MSQDGDIFQEEQREETVTRLLQNAGQWCETRRAGSKGQVRVGQTPGYQKLPRLSEQRNGTGQTGSNYSIKKELKEKAVKPSDQERDFPTCRVDL